MASEPDAGADEAGAGLIALTWGMLAFLTFLMLSVQVALNLYSTTLVSAIGHDAARRGAFTGASPEGLAEAEQWMRSRIGPSIDLEVLSWTTSGDSVSLYVLARPPKVLINATSVLGDRRIERRFTVRTETPTFAGPP